MTRDEPLRQGSLPAAAVTRTVSLRSLGRWFGGAIAVVFAYLGYVYLTLPDVRQLGTANPSCQIGRAHV